MHRITARGGALALALAALGVLASVARADAPDHSTTIARPAADANAPKVPVSVSTLPNGLTLLLSEDHRLPVVSVEVRYLVGSSMERPGRSGFAHLFEHLMFQGSEHYDDEYFKPFEPVGGSVNGTTNQDRTNFFERVPSNYLELALWMESDRMQYLLPALSQEKLDNQREVVKNERRQSYENRPYAMSWLYLQEALFPPSNPYHHPVIGSHADLSAATLGDVRAFFEEYYVPANAVLTIVGDFEAGAARKLVERYFGAIPAGKRATVPEASVPPLERVVHETKTDDVKLPRVYLAWPTPALYHPGDAELDLLSSVLCSGKTSRLYLPLVYRDKLAKDVAAYQVSMRLASYYVVQATAAPGKSVDEVARALLAELAKAAATAPSDDEMTRAKNGYEKSFFERVEGVGSRASLLAGYWQFTGDAGYLPQDLARYTGATSAAVHAAMKRYLDLRHYVRLDIVPGTKPTENR
ncbi:MAG: pitrilysin family protein [Sorangiineae bacterium]|nr:pitrilysin family protein [Polyangiaceae bacterium]MEB2321618.1 pitrilysin family protein [Sorangiineae bacterium]